MFESNLHFEKQEGYFGSRRHQKLSAENSHLVKSNYPARNKQKALSGWLLNSYSQTTMLVNKNSTDEINKLALNLDFI